MFENTRVIFERNWDEWFLDRLGRADEGPAKVFQLMNWSE